MTALLAALLDTLLPGEPPLPPGSAVLTNATTLLAPHQPLLDAIAREAGSAEAFARASEPERTAILQAIERAQPAAFRAMLLPILTEYYDSDAVLIALGWRTDPPQPTGHALEPLDESTLQPLENVRRRGKLWRA